MTRFRHYVAVAGAASLAFVAQSAAAAPCVGFVDVEDTSSFCSSVEWIKNRGVTVGCTATQYCPNDPVSRLQMAAFMTRLGNTLTPVTLQANDTKLPADPPFDLDIPNPSPSTRAPAASLCKTAPFAVPTDPSNNYPRKALIKADFSGGAAGPVQIFGIPVYSTDNGTTFQDVLTYGMRSSIGSFPGAWAYAWQSMEQTATLDLTPGQTYIFAYLVQRSTQDLSPAPEDLVNWRCSVTVQVFSRTGTTPPI